MGKRAIKLSTIIPTQTFYSAEGGEPARRSVAHQACKDQDIPVTGGRRILAATGIQGETGFSVLNGTDPDAGTQWYPEEGFERTRLVVRQRLTPGCRLKVLALALPSGPNSDTAGEGHYWEGGRTGRLKVVATWNNGADEWSGTLDMSVPSSEETHGAEPDAWTPWGIRKLQGFVPIPPPVEDSPDWSGEVDVTIEIIAVASLRLIDCCVHEEPYEIHHDDDDREGTIHLAQGTYPSEYALTGKDLPNDARFGARQILKTLRDQRQLWGPTIMQWSSWKETTAGVTDADPDPLSITSTTFTEVTGTGITTFDEDRAGWSVSSAGNARCAEWSGILELRERVGVIPVVCRVYASVASGGDVGIIRFRSAPHSWCDLRVTSTSYGWVSGLWWMACPIHAEIGSVLQVFARVQATDTLRIRYISVSYGGHAALAV